MENKELSEIIDSKNIIEEEAVLEQYSSDHSFAPRVRPRCIVKVNDADHAQALVKWANKSSTPLIPVSSGVPHFHGDTVPSIGGSIIVDLTGMKQVVRIDRRNRVAMIEPGVTFSQLIPLLEKEGLKLNSPLLPRANKSVIGSMLEREPVIMPLYQWDILDPLTCIEIIFGTGDVFRTGSAAGPGTLEEQWKAKMAQVNPMGPGQTDFARVVQGAQGTMGIVTWATVRCELLPKIHKPFLVGSNSLEKLTELVYQMLWLKNVEECLVLSNSSLSAMMAKDPAEYDTIRNNFPRWILFFCLGGFEYFPEEKIAYQEKDVINACLKVGITLTNSLYGFSPDKLLNLIEKPSDTGYWKLLQKGACQDILFLTTMDKAPRFIEIVRKQAEEVGFPLSDIGNYIQPMVQGTACHVEFEIFYNPESGQEKEKAQKLYLRATEAIMNSGGFFSRPYDATADLAYGRDTETTNLLRKMKGIFDPQNIMNPGKLCF